MEPSHIRRKNRHPLQLEILEDRITPVSLDYAISFGVAGHYSIGQALATDPAGNTYLTGRFPNTVDFDPGPGIYNLTAVGTYSMYVAKYDPAGNLAWARSVGSVEDNEIGNGIAVDLAGYVYVTGRYSDVADFDPGPGTFLLSSAGGDEAFVLKLDSVGDFVWAASLGGGYTDAGLAITLDSSANVYVAGSFQRTADFDPGPGTFNLVSAGISDVFVTKFSSAGALVWAMRMGGNSSDIVKGISVDAAGNVFTTGYFMRTADFDPGAGVFNLNATAQEDVFVSKLDNTGNFLWALRMGGSSLDIGNSFVFDPAGNIYLAGTFTTTVDFDPGAGVFNLTSVGSRDGFLAKLDSSGNFLWAGRIGGISQDECQSITLDATNNIYVTGYFENTIDLDLGPGIFNLTSDSLADVFVAKYDSGGSFVWGFRIGDTSDDEGHAIVVDSANSVIVTGFISSTTDFDPGPGVVNVREYGIDDAFLAKFRQYAVLTNQSGGSTRVLEGGTADDITLVLNQAPTANVVVTLSPDSQVLASAVVFTFTPANWNVPQTVTLTAVDDALVEATHSGSISIATSSADPNFNGLATSSLTAAIDDNDLAAGVVVTESGGTTTIAEGGAVDTYTIVLSGLPAANVTVGMSGSSQYTTSPTNLVFTSANWSTPQTVTVTAVDDALIEGAHSGVIAFTTASADANYNALTVPSLTASITDNDLVAAGVLVTPSAGSTDVSEAGGIDSYTVALNALPTANVIVTLSTTSQLLPSTPTLTFTPANWSVAQTVVVQANDDAIAQGTRTQNITHTATSSDPGYNGIAIAAVTVNITDNDTAGITFSTLNVDLAEGGTSNTYTAVLNSQPTVNVIVNVAGDSQVSLVTSTLVFTPGNWNVAQTIRVQAVDDTLAEGLHNGLITHTLTSGDVGYNGMTRTVTARISDNESSGVLISQTNGPLTILEGTSKTYTAVLNSPPTSDVVLNINPDPQVNVAPMSITFTPGDWNVPRPVVVTANDDGVEEGDHVGRITHTTTSASAAFNNLTVAGVTASIVDNDGSAAFGTERADQILVSFTPANIKVTVNSRITTLPNTLTQLLLFAGFGNDSIQILAPTIPVVVIGGPGVDKVFIIGQAASNNFVLGDSVVNVNGQSVGVWEAESLTVGGKAGNDTFTVTDVPAFPVELKGDAGTDVVVGPNRANTWQITGASAGTLDASIKISALENWTGGASTDSFVFAAGKAIAGRVDGGLGANTLDFSTATAAITVNLQTGVATGSKSFANITALIGGKGTADKLLAADQSNLWNITATNSGSVSSVSFRNFENLTGGIQDDTFLFADNQGVKGKIDGAAGSDLLDFTAYLSRPVSVNLQLKAATNTGGFANVEAFQGGSGSADSFLGVNKVSAWNVSGAGSGDVGGVAFGNFENLTGGSLTDNFLLDAAADWLGTLNGGTGTDTLTAAPGLNSWLLTGLNAGTLNGRKFSAMEIRR